MGKRARYAAALGVAVLLLSVFGLWVREGDARPQVADFAPTYSLNAAAERVAQARAAEGQRTPVTSVYFPQTGHHLDNQNGFLDYWRTTGQVLILGYPITEPLVENGRLVQYFERARLEQHLELANTPYAIQLGLLGREFLGDHAPAGVADGDYGALSAAAEPALNAFQHHWQQRGGLATFGYPLTPPIEEDGRLVQYFERTRLEYHPEDLAPFYQSAEARHGFAMPSLREVLGSDLGRQVAAAHGYAIEPVAPRADAAIWAPSLWQRHIDVDLSAQQLTAYEGDLVVWRAPISTGKDGFNTPKGTFAIYDRLPSQTMRGSAGGETWTVPNVPWVQYIVGGVALHGTYWHNLFGSGARISHGCINLPMDDAQWLYEWADIGTTVIVHA